jgi:hypothetical protein
MTTSDPQYCDKCRCVRCEVERDRPNAISEALIMAALVYACARSSGPALLAASAALLSSVASRLLWERRRARVARLLLDTEMHRKEELRKTKERLAELQALDAIKAHGSTPSDGPR